MRKILESELRDLDIAVELGDDIKSKRIIDVVDKVLKEFNPKFIDRTVSSNEPDHYSDHHSREYTAFCRVLLHGLGVKMKVE